jgi:hypothetical protein
MAEARCRTGNGGCTTEHLQSVIVHQGEDNLMYHVLIVEDAEFALEFLGEQLKSYGDFFYTQLCLHGSGSGGDITSAGYSSSCRQFS